MLVYSTISRSQRYSKINSIMTDGGNKNEGIEKSYGEHEGIAGSY